MICHTFVSEILLFLGFATFFPEFLLFAKSSEHVIDLDRRVEEKRGKS
jgi:hypothetical protein